jgi:hypothetical protein
MVMTKEKIITILESARNRLPNGGAHLGEVRAWMQRRFRNGSTVQWSSREHLTGTDLTPHELENLALDIAAAAVEDVWKIFSTEFGLSDALGRDGKKL